jgi:hypothetical protein
LQISLVGRNLFFASLDLFFAWREEFLGCAVPFSRRFQGISRLGHVHWFGSRSCNPGFGRKELGGLCCGFAGGESPTHGCEQCAERERKVLSDGE